MNPLIALTQSHYKQIRLILFITLSSLTLFCIGEAIYNNVFRESFAGIVVTAELIGLTFLSLLSGYIYWKVEEASPLTRQFTLFYVTLYVSAFLSSIGIGIYHTPGHVGLLTTLSTLSYFFVTMAYLMLWYYEKQFIPDSPLIRAVSVLILVVVSLYTICIIVNLFHPILFLVTEDGGFSESVTDYISIITGCLCLILLFVATLFSSMSRTRKFSFLCCIFAPALFATCAINYDVLGMGIYLLGLFCYMILLPLSLVFFSSHEGLEQDLQRYEEEHVQLQVSAMISQMQPHFLHNSLAVIAALCEEDPKLAARATTAFSDYLRENLNFADKSNPVSFSKELNHIRTYVWLEELRFPNKLTVEYDINCTAFQVPALSVQPMVENAIKHGICKARSGGTVRLSSRETDTAFLVTISDDGVGFDVGKTADDANRHLGIENSRERIRKMMGGSLDIESTPGEGTVVTITIPK